MIPVTTAALGYFVLNRPRRWLGKVGIPPAGAAFFFTAIILIATIFAMVKLSEPVSEFIEGLPHLMADIETQLSMEGGALEAVNEAAEAADEVLNPGKEQTLEVEVVERSGIATVVAGFAPGLLSQIGFSIILLFFLVLSGDMFIRKVLQLSDRFKDKRRTVEVVHRIEHRLGSYLGGITLINISLGVAIGVSMWVWGLPNPAMFGVMAALLNFVPFVGAILGSAIAVAIAFTSIGGIWPAVGVWATYMALTSIEAQMITPLLISRHMKINTTVVFLSVAFFAWIWSVMGMIVTLPILTVIKIASEEIDALHNVGVFLGQDTPPKRALYQK